MGCNCASLLKLLHSREPWRPVAACSGRDKCHHSLQRPRTGDSLDSSSGSNSESPIVARLLRSVMFHRVSRWTSISKIASSAPGMLQPSPQTTRDAS